MKILVPVKRVVDSNVKSASNPTVRVGPSSTWSTP